MKRLALLVIAGCEILEAPRPPEPPTPPVPAPIAPCKGDRVQVKDAWTLALHDAGPAPGPDRVVYRRGLSWGATTITEIPHSPKNRFDFDNPYDTRVDRDGTVYFRGLWYGNPDQTNNVGDGLYRLDGTRATPLVDPATRLPNDPRHFNSAGGFDVDDGWLVFWGGRPYDVHGVYAWHAGQVFAIADTTMSVRGTGSPVVRAGRVAFQGEEQGVRGVYLWTQGTGVQRILRSHGPIFANVALGEHVVYAGGYDPRRVIAWSAGTEWIAASPEWFIGGVGDQPILQTDPSVRGDDLVVTVAQAKRSEVWNVAGCRLERVAGTGDRVGQLTIESVNVPPQAELPGGALALLAGLSDGSRRLVRAYRK